MQDRVIRTCMNQDVTAWVADCQECAHSKVTMQPAAPLPPVPRQCFSHIHVDILGLLPVSKEGFRVLFTIIDRSSRILEAVPLVHIETISCQDTIIRKWICQFSIPAQITLDQGAQFT